MARDEQVFAMVNPEERRAIEVAAEHTGLTVSSFVRRCALAGVAEVSMMIREEEEEHGGEEEAA